MNFSHLKLNIFLFSLLVYILTSSLQAETLPHIDDFENSSADGWSYDKGDTNELELGRADTSYKIYNFGIANANKEVTIIFQIDVFTNWESDQDKIVTTINDSEVYEYYTGDVFDKTISYQATLSSTGTLKIQLEAATNNNDEELQVEYVQIISGVHSVGDREFSLRNTYTVFGDVITTGNTVLCQLNAAGTECEESEYNVGNRYVDLQKAPQSSSTVTIPTNSEIKLARLYWVGRKQVDTVWDDSSINNASKIKIRKDLTGTFTEFTADYIDIDYNINRPIYSASVDVTDFVSESGIYDIDTSSFYTLTGTTSDTLGTYGAWTLVVVYEDPNESTAKNITIFDGFKQITGDDVDISVSGFLTPKDDDVDSTLYVFASEGDKYLSGDKISMGGKLHNTTKVVLGDFDSRIDTDGTRVPDLINNNGIDIQKYNVGTTTGAEDIITNSETGANFTFSTDSDHYFASLLIFSTQIYIPKFCYDYAYKQNGIYFTENNDGANDPHITYNSSNPISANTPVEVVLYFKNQIDSDLSAENVFLNITDMNISQIQYINDSTKIQLSTDLEPISKDDIDWNTQVSNSYIKDIPLGTQSPNDYFYIYYSVNPTVETSLHSKISAELRYDLSLSNGTSIPYTLELGSKVPLCTTSNFEYRPVKGRFNVVDTPIYTGSGFYNLPTQIVNRRGSFSVIAIDNDFSDLTDNFIDINTSVWVEMIDMGAFHLNDASCTQVDSNISERIKVELVSGIADLSTIDSFNTQAKQNAAFRISYLEPTEEGESLIEYEVLPDGKYKITNFSELDKIFGSTCSAPVLNPTSNIDTDQVKVACGNAGTVGVTKAQYDACFECVFGINTKRICSRDNFSIRPEAFMIKLNDQNQTDPSSKTRLSDTVSGVTTTPSTTTTNLASGYNYSMEITAVDYEGNTPSIGYSRSFESNSPDDKISYAWNESTPVTCNDEGNKGVDVYINDGYIDLNTSVTQVGDYNLSMIDTTWTTVDSNPSDRAHHDEDTYLQGSTTLDCTANSSATIAEGAIGKNGCNISSNHDATGTNLKYRNYKITFHPYKFDVSSITPTTGINKNPLTTNSFIYMSDMNNTEDMALHLNGDIVASGYDGTKLTNFTTSCYAKSIDLNIINDINSSSNPIYRYRYHNDNNIPSDINGTLDTTNDFITLPTTNFRNDQNGSISTKLHLNFERKTNVAVNPRRVTYGNYNINCTTPSECRFNADLRSDKETEGNVTITQSINHLYGRTNSPRKVFSGADGISPIYFEVHCNATDSFGVGCNKNLLPNGSDSNTTDDPRWFINSQHTSNDGVIGTVGQKNYSKVSATNPAPFGAPTNVSLHYDEGSGYPYKATMDNIASKWLIYNKYDASKSKNEFEVEFVKGASSWGGVDDANSTSQTQENSKTNRRIMW